MGTWTLLPRVDRVSDVGALVATSAWTTITASATVNTKGAYTQLIASTPFAADGFNIGIRMTTASATVLVDLAVGAAAAEQIILPDIFHRNGTSTATAPFTVFYVPIHIKDGQRIAARCQSATASQACTVGLYLYGAT
jgi:hypothetical protein